MYVVSEESIFFIFYFCTRYSSYLVYIIHAFADNIPQDWNLKANVWLIESVFFQTLRLEWLFTLQKYYFSADINTSIHKSAGVSCLCDFFSELGIDDFIYCIKSENASRLIVISKTRGRISSLWLLPCEHYSDISIYDKRLYVSSLTLLALEVNIRSSKLFL